MKRGSIIGLGLLLTGCGEYIGPSEKGLAHDVIYGNPNKRNWECVGQCPQEVIEIERRTDRELAEKRKRQERTK